MSNGQLDLTDTRRCLSDQVPGSTDHAALATLEQRGVTKEERKQIKALVHLVETTLAPAVEDAVAPPDARRAALTALRVGAGRSDCARSVITRRDQLLRLGIGKRRAHEASVTPQP